MMPMLRSTTSSASRSTSRVGALPPRCSGTRTGRRWPSPARTGSTRDRARLASDGAERGDWQERVAHSDALTGLANAQTLARVIELEIARAARQASELCLALFDVDDIRGINETAGRGAGDDVLREVAA